MTRTFPPPLDDVACRLLDSLQIDARAPLKTLAKATGLSVAATAERLKRLQDAGVVGRFTVELDATKAGYPVKAIIGITAIQPGKKPLLERLMRAPEVIECHHVAGADSYVMTVMATDLADLERFVSTINPYGETRMSIIFSTPVERRSVVAPGLPKRPSRVASTQ